MEHWLPLLPVLLGGIVIAAAFWLFDIWHEARRHATPKQALSGWQWGHAGVALCGLVAFDLYALVAGIVLAFLVDTVRFALWVRRQGWTVHAPKPALEDRRG